MPSVTGGDAGGSSSGWFTNVASSIPIVGSIVSAISQGFTNRANRKFQEKMYNRERQDSLADWNMQNAYNSPTAQMARLKDGGLNPNMIYGTGSQAAVGNAGSMPRQSTPAGGSTYQNPIPSDIGSSIFAGAIQQQQLKNLQAQEAAIKADTIKKSADTLNVGSRTDLSKFELGLKQSLFETILGQANANLSRTLVGTNIMNAANDRAQSSFEVGIKQQAQSLINARLDELQKQSNLVTSQFERKRIQAQIINLYSAAQKLDTDSDLKQMEIDLQKKGGSMHDEMIFRMLRKLVDKWTGTGN